jgi:deoxycitidine kinase
MSVVAIEGNIGAGKSTLLRLLAKRGLRTVDEPLKKWRGEEGGSANLLQLFYGEPTRWAFTFQTAAFLTRAQSAAAALRDPTAPADARWVLERSLLSDKHCFATNCLKTELFTTAEWGVYDDFHTWLMGEFPSLRIDGAVYVRTQPQTCLARLRQRGRAEEATIPVEYLEQVRTPTQQRPCMAAAAPRSIAARARPQPLRLLARRRAGGLTLVLCTFGARCSPAAACTSRGVVAGRHRGGQRNGAATRGSGGGGGGARSVACRLVGQCACARARRRGGL